MYKHTASTTIGQTIWDQISTGVKMACGARQPVAFADGLMFRVSIRPRKLTKIRIVLTPLDLYDVHLLQLRDHATATSTLGIREMVNAESLSEVVYNLCHR